MSSNSNVQGSTTSTVDSSQTLSSPSQELPHYLVRGDTLEYGASFGNAHCWLITRGKGSIEELFSTDIGQVVCSTIAVRYASTGHHLLRSSVHEQGGSASGSDIQLRPDSSGTVELHPSYQRRSFSLPERLNVKETIFLPLITGDDPAVAYYQIEITHRSKVERRVSVYGYGRISGALGHDIFAEYDPELRALVTANRCQPDAVRVFGSTAPVTAYETSTDYGSVYDVLHMANLRNDTSAEGDILAALQIDLNLDPNEKRTFAFVLAFSHRGKANAIATYRDAEDVNAALDQTIAHVQELTNISRVLTPHPTINAGVLWSKINMLRVMARYPQGPAFTNDPSKSSVVVGRDAFWFVYGNDHFKGDFSRDLLDTWARKQGGEGKIPEYYSALDGHTEDDGLNINDDTPLYILAINHHYRTTGDLHWLRGIYPSAARAARYIVSQEDERGLVYCTANDPRGNVYAIASWRNVIADYKINGAVTEINAECVAALRAAGHLAENIGRPVEEAQEFFDASTRLREAMDKHLINPKNGLYYLNIATEGVIHTDVTGDEVFPVIFRACSEEVGFRIISRLNHPDFWTPAGLRTVSSEDPLYDPSQFYGLLGGVWPGLSWWYAFAAARYHSEIMVRALTASFEHYARNPKSNNTVPGQFSEWFDGESLVNRGMRLSPWEPPRFLWAAIEGVCGVVLQPDKPKINPLVPAHWRWVGLRRLPYHGQEVTFFATREHPSTEDSQFHLYATIEVDTDHALEVYEEDVTDKVRVLDPHVCHLALRRPGETVVFLGNTGNSTTIVPVELSAMLESGKNYTLHLYDGASYGWREGVTSTAAEVCTPALSIEASGFDIIKFVEAE